MLTVSFRPITVAPCKSTASCASLREENVMKAVPLCASSIGYFTSLKNSVNYVSKKNNLKITEYHHNLQKNVLSQLLLLCMRFQKRKLDLLPEKKVYWELQRKKAYSLGFRF